MRVPAVLNAKHKAVLVLGHRGAHPLEELILVLAALLLHLRQVHETRPLRLGHFGGFFFSLFSLLFCWFV